jgi:hypothetical protein
LFQQAASEREKQNLRINTAFSWSTGFDKLPFLPFRMKKRIRLDALKGKKLQFPFSGNSQKGRFFNDLTKVTYISECALTL